MTQPVYKPRRARGNIRRRIGPYSLWLRVIRYGSTFYVVIGGGRIEPWHQSHRTITVRIGATWYRS